MQIQKKEGEFNTYFDQPNDEIQLIVSSLLNVQSVA